ncbi:MAG: hypothetical protein EOP45_00710 [Sphingobacteriaceae bacterium]|nr:MAG: hypothetical protein EOP45_00710 [Sphingobacteriaceae bacterium]
MKNLVSPSKIKLMIISNFGVNMSWFKARWNKDNFWNLMFWLGITANMVLVDIFANLVPVLALIFFILGLTITPYLLARVNKVVFTEEKVFINKQRESLEKKYPKHLSIIIPIAIAVSINCFFAFNKSFPNFEESMAVYAAIGLAVPVLYFIILNCPISILFNKNAWNKQVTGLDHSSSCQHSFPPQLHKHKEPMLMPRSRYTDPKYSYLDGNTFNRRY